MSKNPAHVPFEGELRGTSARRLAADLGGSARDNEPIAHTLVGAAEGLTDWWLGGGGDQAADREPADVLADMLMAVVWPGLDALRRR